MVSVKWDNGNYGYYRWPLSLSLSLSLSLPLHFPLQVLNLKGWELGTSMS